MASTEENAGPGSKRTLDLALWVAVGLFAAAWFVLLLRNLGYLSLWMDEGFHYLAADGILKHGYPLFPSGHIYYKVALYSYILAGMAKLFGLTAATLRVVSLICSTALIALAYHVGRRFFSRTIGALAAVILALSVWVAEDARLALYFAPMQLAYLVGLYAFYRGFVEDSRKWKIWATVILALIPHLHQLGMGLYFCFPILIFLRGWRRFFKKDVLISFAIVTLAYLGVQLHEFFFWKVGYVYQKTETGLRGMLHYFFSSFNLAYFKEFFRSFPIMSLTVLVGLGIFAGRRFGRAGAEPGAGEAEERERRPWLYLILGLIFPLLFFGIFRTHVQPRYLAQLYPVFVLLYLAALSKFAPALADLLAWPFGGFRPRARRAASCVLFLLLAFLTVEGSGPKSLLSIINRNYNDPITADKITRSGRFEHEDHQGPGEYVRHFLRDDDIVIAIHVVFQKIYAGRVDYWLWSGGPGTWDAWEKTPTGWRDFYVGARWINDLAGLKAVIEGHPDRRVWLIASPSIGRRDHINQTIADYIQGQEGNLVFRGKDETSEVYLWHDGGALTASSHTYEGEWLPSRRGRTMFAPQASKQAFMSWAPGARESFAVEMPGTYPAGRYRIRLKLRPGAAGTGREVLDLAVESVRRGTRRRTLAVAAGAAEAQGDFVLPEEDRLKLRFLVTGAAGFGLDDLDILPAGGN